ncbi:uncharacterized protein LOC116936524 isoform X1 [Daphnia magna]|uniref:uncharacterized protein LOC116936524 isoform X1 n=1 Tax=Daphnia magna TaxID=35525 RepID=UPI001E1BA355|nr:uncharacterized protein LOC116936524 isoform X1 [Daphnia magna]XP_045035768.1 uncharacterized protein LOC116936524 isoform X1 [Daphnia magna]XP_045035771.1 uncharacterized protein LOC116936524 isoform X1 [Daphnia magna]XP_045035774.1 uncharacterized protein LOC116936524 isoform X1 [Daphnia magna]XP_045035777.1 uncharacterized protein LOC116936524 isoform X1 [Daphnia magna]XP_045035781.1 uncharacterized protein LOC116936524 isoform X1 [Daphnia magna]XP_045035786.1 uncharacterized protein LO
MCFTMFSVISLVVFSTVTGNVPVVSGSVSSVTDSGPMLQIVEMRVPAVVEDGSATSVILDCDYVLRSADKKSELVVQWYFQNGSSPVYQWIPGKRPQDLGVLKGRLNLDYRASNDPHKRHRALEILKPTYELSGVYRCKVATVEEEAVAARTMIIYTPARNLEIWHQKMSFDAVNVTCRVEGISPRPRLQLYRGDRPGLEMDGMPAEVVNRRGLYDVTLYRVVHDRSLRQETIFECVLSIPATQYQIARRLIYYPGPAPIRSSSSSMSSDLIGFRSFREFLVFPGRNPIRETLEKTPQPSSIYHCQQNHFACTFLPREKKNSYRKETTSHL